MPNRRLFFASTHSYRDLSTRAASATGELLELITSRGSDCRSCAMRCAQLSGGNSARQRPGVDGFARESRGRDPEPRREGRGSATSPSTQSEPSRPERTPVTLRRTATIRDERTDLCRLRNSLCSNALHYPRRMRRIKCSLSLSPCLTNGRTESSIATRLRPASRPFRIQCAANPVRPIALSCSSKQSRPWTTKNDRGQTNFGTRPWMSSSQPLFGQCLHAFIFVQGRSGRSRLMTCARPRWDVEPQPRTKTSATRAHTRSRGCERTSTLSRSESAQSSNLPDLTYVVSCPAREK
jgi:hypothetical protein